MSSVAATLLLQGGVRRLSRTQRNNQVPNQLFQAAAAGGWVSSESTSCSSLRNLEQRNLKQLQEGDFCQNCKPPKSVTNPVTASEFRGRARWARAHRARRPADRANASTHHADMEYINGAAPSFKGLPLPEGVDRHNLYASAFRVRHQASESAALSGQHGPIAAM